MIEHESNHMSNSQNIEDNNKRIAKNTIYLYFRMLVLMLLGLYTSRVVIKALGIEDYGLYNVVGGFVGMLTIFNGLLAGGSSRFITFYLGQGNESRLKEVFGACVTIHLVMGLLILLFGETAGLWFVNNKLTIDAARMDAANWVYQFALFSTFISVVQTPYSAAVLAHEKMSAFAYLAIFDVVVKLAMVFMLLVIPFDKLISYAVFYFIINFLVFCLYYIYCMRHFAECTFKMGFDRQLYRDMFVYTGWNTVGAIAFMGKDQGVNVLLNIFFGTVVNGARGIAMTISGIVNQFITNFQNSAAPQIIKYYSSGDTQQMNSLICNTAKYATYIFMIIAIPIFIEADTLLDLWLGEVPPYSVWFVRLTILQTLVMSIDGPVGRGIHAFGKMMLPNLTSALIYMSILPISWVAIKMGASPVVAYWVTVSVYPMALLCDLWILNRFSGFDVMHFLRDAVVRCVVYCILIGAIPYAIHAQMPPSFVRLVLVGGISVILSLLVIYYLGIPKHLRQQVVGKIKAKLRHE